MRVFLDTNILMESVTNRSHSAEISRIYNLYKTRVVDCYISQGSFIYNYISCGGILKENKFFIQRATFR